MNNTRVVAEVTFDCGCSMVYVFDLVDATEAKQWAMPMTPAKIGEGMCWVADEMRPGEPDIACQFCNEQKLSNRVPDPCRVAYGECLRVEPNGKVTALNAHGRRLMSVIRLNHPVFVQQRCTTMKVLRLLAIHDRTEYEQLMGFPPDLPDLSTLKPPGGNRRPGGVVESCLARKMRGDLPSVYL